MTHLDELISLVSHPAIQGRRVEWEDADAYAIESLPGKWVVENHHTDNRSAITRHQQGYDPVWLPPLSDPIQPERGLMGLMKERWELKQHMDGGFVLRTITGRVSTGPTPEIAVAKALIAQEQK